MDQTRRNILKIGGLALAMIPVAAMAAKNDKMRANTKYTDNAPDPAKKCGGCAQFVPGKSPTDLGGCRLFAGDTEVSPNGTCIAFSKKP